jgi:hypothetical protein
MDDPIKNEADLRSQADASLAAAIGNLSGQVQAGDATEAEFRARLAARVKLAEEILQGGEHPRAEITRLLTADTAQLVERQARLHAIVNEAQFRKPAQNRRKPVIAATLGAGFAIWMGYLTWLLILLYDARC